MENTQMTQKNTPVAIIGAMEQEIALLQSRIAQPQHEKVAHVAITRGTLAGKPILLAQSGIGKVNADRAPRRRCHRL